VGAGTCGRDEGMDGGESDVRTTDSDGLKPCPFCGAGESNVEPAGRVWREGAWRHEHWTVMHDCAEAESWPAQTLIIRGTTREQAIARWNQRSQENAR
jgi:hypothetical protein